MDAFLKQLRSNIADRQLLPHGERILVAVSGGVDSMVLLHALSSLSVEMGWDLTVGHLNHLLRGRSSDGDAEFVESFAQRRGIRFCGSAAEVRTLAHQNGLSLEMAGRQARHAFFKRAARDNQCTSVALAHHADDQVELFFLRLLRGSGDGLGGMQWNVEFPSHPSLRLVRPLLNLSKAVLQDFAVQTNIAFRKDASNADLDFQRNRIRHKLLPLLRREYQAGLDSVLLRTMEILSAEAHCVGDIARQWLNTRRPEFSSLSVAVQRRALQGQLIVAGVVPDFAQVESLRSVPHRPVNLSGVQRANLRQKREGTGAQVPLTIAAASVARDEHGLIFFPEPASKNPGVSSLELPVELNLRGKMSLGGGSLKWRIENPRNTGAGPRLKGRGLSEYFDADELGERIFLRHWRPGDRFCPIGLNQTVKLQDLFTNAKIPRNLRHTLILGVTERGDIFWVEGLRISERFKVTPATQRYLVWQWKRS